MTVKYSHGIESFRVVRYVHFAAKVYKDENTTRPCNELSRLRLLILFPEEKISREKKRHTIRGSYGKEKIRNDFYITRLKFRYTEEKKALILKK